MHVACLLEEAGLAAALAARLLLVRQLDLVGELIVQLHVRLLGKGVLGHRLEGLLHVQGLLGTRLEVWDAVLGLAPTLGTLGGHLW